MHFYGQSAQKCLELHALDCTSKMQTQVVFFIMFAGDFGSTTMCEKFTAVTVLENS